MSTIERDECPDCHRFAVSYTPIPTLSGRSSQWAVSTERLHEPPSAPVTLWTAHVEHLAATEREAARVAIALATGHQDTECQHDPPTRLG